MCGEDEAAPLTPMQALLRCSTTRCISLLPDAFRLSIVVLWHAMKMTSASVPARSAIVIMHAQALAGSAECARRPASFLGEVHQAIRRAGGNPDRPGGIGKGKRPVQCAGPGRSDGADA